MARYDRGMSRYSAPQRGDWSHPYGGAPGGMPFDRSRAGYRPWTGGYRAGYQGGSGGIPTTGARPTSYGRDYWWLGEHELRRGRQLTSYDDAYRDFDQRTHPRYTPVGGMYHAMGGRYAYSRPPRPLREDTWFSEWTRWF